MASITISIIIDEKVKSVKLINNRPGYDMKYAESYIYEYCGINNYQRYFDELFETERQYDTLSVIQPNETPQQWAIRVRVPLQELVSEGKRSLYHVHCLFGGFGNSKLINHDYYRPRIHKANVAICLDCMKLIHIDNVKPTKTFHYARSRYVEIIKPEDLMQKHWDYECSKPKTKDASARIIQSAWKRFRGRVPSNARLVWNSLPNDNTPDDEKFLGLTRHKIKNPQTREQFNQWHTKWIELYKQCNLNIPLDIYVREYEEYYIPVNWIDSKKRQLRTRFRKRLLEIEA
nr:1993_t:CDS:1 [Entrophospora candida]